MGKESVFRVASTALADILDQPGRILYSSHATLQKGDIYYLGFNPGGEGGDLLGDVLPELLERTDNAYLDESWAPGGKPRPPGRAPLQLRTVALLEGLGFSPRSVCASNLIFVRSRGSESVAMHLADTCWPVHRAILDLVQPKLILCCGNSIKSSYGFLRNRFGGVESAVAAGHQPWQIRGFDTVIDGRPCSVVGLPHLSRYDPRNKVHVVDWIRHLARLSERQ